MKLRSALSLTLVTATALLGACRDDGLVAPGVVTEPAPKVLGLVEITLTGIGTPGMKATVTPFRGGPASAAGGPSYALSAVPGGGIQVGSRTASTLDSRGQRYLQAVFAVRNASTDGTANTTARSNVTFIPVSTASTIAGTPFSRFLKQDGSAADPAIATQLVPTGAVASDGAGGVTPQYADVMQAFSEDELAAVTTPAGVTNKFAYGYVVRRVESDGSLNATTRELPANPAAGQFDGAVTFAYRFPIQATSADNPFTISIVALAVDDSETRVTQSLEEQTAAGRTAFEARVASLNAAGITLLPGGTSNSTRPKRMLCSVRTAGDAGAATRTLTGLTVIINEIMANPAKVDDTLGEYFEVFNPCSEPVNLRNWRIVSAGTTAEANTGHVIASDVIVPAGGYAVLANNDVSGTNGGFTANYKFTGINLNNSTTDWLALRTSANASIDSVSWAAVGGETASSPPNGASRALVDPLRDNLFMSGASSSWVASSTSTPYGQGDFGTPGSANNVTIVTGPPATVNVGPDFVTTRPGTTVQYSADVRDAGGNQVSNTLTWVTTNTAVATVDATGKVTAVADGDVYVKATTTNGMADSTRLQVFTEPTSAVYRNHLEFGKPLDADPAGDTIVSRQEYVLSYSEARGGPNWVSWNLNASQYGYVSRCDCFSPDNTTDIPAGVYRVETRDYTGSGFTRGHMVRSEERTLTAAENRTTFLMTNILPQTSELNAGPWGALEFDVETLAKFRGKELYVIAGGTYSATPATLSSSTRVQIPSTTWKIVAILPAGKGLADVATADDIQLIVVNMPNTTNAATPGFSSSPWRNYTTTVDVLEAATGYNFLSLLPDAIEDVVEARASLTTIN